MEFLCVHLIRRNEMEDQRIVWGWENYFNEDNLSYLLRGSMLISMQMNNIVSMFLNVLRYSQAALLESGSRTDRYSS